MYGDILPERDNRPGTYVTSIAKLTMSHRIVGYVYTMKDGVRLMQTTYDMPADMLHALELSPLQIKPLRNPLPSGLLIAPCTKAELSKRPH